MIELGLPLMLLLLPLPLLVRWLLPAALEGRGGALRVPFYAALGALPGGAGGEGRRGRTALVLKSLAWIFLRREKGSPLPLLPLAGSAALALAVAHCLVTFAQLALVSQISPVRLSVTVPSPLSVNLSPAKTAGVWQKKIQTAKNPRKINIRFDIFPSHDLPSCKFCTASGRR